MKKSLDIIGTALLLVGFLFAFLPHATHVTIGLGGESHFKHVIFGTFLILAGLGTLIYNNDALRWSKK